MEHCYVDNVKPAQVTARVAVRVWPPARLWLHLDAQSLV